MIYAYIKNAKQSFSGVRICYFHDCRHNYHLTCTPVHRKREATLTCTKDKNSENKNDISLFRKKCGESFYVIDTFQLFTRKFKIKLDFIQHKLLFSVCFSFAATVTPLNPFVHLNESNLDFVWYCIALDTSHELFDIKCSYREANSGT